MAAVKPKIRFLLLVWIVGLLPFQNSVALTYEDCTGLRKEMKKKVKEYNQKAKKAAMSSDDFKKQEWYLKTEVGLRNERDKLVQNYNSNCAIPLGFPFYMYGHEDAAEVVDPSKMKTDKKPRNWGGGSPPSNNCGISAESNCSDHQ